MKDKEEDRGSEQGLEGVPSHFMEPLSCCCCCCCRWLRTAEGETREGGGGGSRLPPAGWPQGRGRGLRAGAGWKDSGRFVDSA